MPKIEQLSHKQVYCYNHCNSRINIAEGSVRSGKSFSLLLRFLEELKSGPDGQYVIAGKSERTVIHNIIEPLQEITGGIIRYNRGLGEFKLFGRKVYVVGANDERAEGKIRGSTFAGALVDEISIIPETFFRMLLSRLSVPSSKLFGSTNPDSPYHWLKTDFLDRTSELDISVHKFRLTDNPSLEASYVKNLTAEYQGLWHKRFILGEWVLAEGAIYDMFDETYHTIANPKTYAKYYVCGVDYGTANTFAAVLVGFNDDVRPNLWVEKEFYWDAKKMGCQKTDAEYAFDLVREFGCYSPRLYYIDPSAASFETEMKRQKQPVKQAKNDVLDGIRYVSSLFSMGDLAICKGCTNLLREIEGYVWDPKSVKLGEDKPLKQKDHALDALRYAIFSHFGARETLKEYNREQSYENAQQKKYAANPMAYPGYTNSYGWQRY
jgi:PBSX family phage terminase large subunit